MSAGPPPPPPVKLTDTSLKLAELDPCFKEQSLLERQISRLNIHKMSPYERSHIPTDYPDILSLSNLTHVLALVGPFARYTAEELAAIRLVVKDQLAFKVDRFKQIGDVVNARKEMYKKDKALVDLPETKRMVVEMKELCEEVKVLAGKVEEMALQLREEKKGFSSEQLPSVERKTYPLQGAGWFCEPILAYLRELEMLNATPVRLNQPLTTANPSSDMDIDPPNNVNANNPNFNATANVPVPMQVDDSNAGGLLASSSSASIVPMSTSSISIATFTKSVETQPPLDVSSSTSSLASFSSVSSLVSITSPASPNINKRTVKDFVRWCANQQSNDVTDGVNQRLVLNMVTQMGAFVGETKMVDKKLLEARVKEYIKYFKGSLPPECVLK